MHSTVGVEREAQSTNSGREMSLTALNIKGETLYVDYQHGMYLTMPNVKREAQFVDCVWEKYLTMGGWKMCSTTMGIEHDAWSVDCR